MYLEKVIFGELFNAIKGNRIVAFAIATTVSSLIFALAHNDYKFIPIYFGMGVIFSLAYVMDETTCCSNYYPYVTKWICRYIPIT